MYASPPIVVLPAGYARNINQVHPNFNAALNFQHVTKMSEQVTVADATVEALRRAFTMVKNGRPGPVLVEFPTDILRAEIPDELVAEYKPAPKMKSGPDPQSVSKIAEALVAAERPLIHVGQGVHYAKAWPQLKALAELLEAPVMTTLGGKSAFPENHPLCLGMFGMHGSRYANYAVQGADLLVALGARFDDRVTGKLSTFAPEAKIVHLDVDPAEISKLVTATVPLVGDLKVLLPKLHEEVRRAFESHARPDISAWKKKVADWREKHPLRYKQAADGPLLPQYVIETLWKKTGGKAIVTTGVGEHQMFAAQWWKTSEPRQFITSGGLGTMGFCMPSAIGIQLARPDALVIGIDGDGSFQMTLQDLATASEHKLPFKIFILNNLFLGMVRQWQELFYSERFAETPLADLPDLVKLADAYGCLGLRARTVAELDRVVDQALANDKGPTIVDVRIRPETKVYPMVPAGAPLNDMIDGE